MSRQVKIGLIFVMLFILGFYAVEVSPRFLGGKLSKTGGTKTEESCSQKISQSVKASLETLSADSWGIYCVSDKSLLVLMDGKNINKRQGIASITKIATDYLAEQTWNDEEVFKIPAGAIGYGTSRRYLPGEEFKVGELLSSLIVESDNDVARTFAIQYGTEMFLRRMNLFAKNLGLQNTTFRDPAGLDIQNEPSNLSTVADVAKMAKFVFTNSRHFKYDAHESTREIYSVTGFHHSAVATNKLLATPLQKNIIAWKTGDTGEARKNLVVMFSNEKGENFVSVVLHSEDHMGDTRRIIEGVVK